MEPLPQGIVGEELDLPYRILTVADMFDALQRPPLPRRHANGEGLEHPERRERPQTAPRKRRRFGRVDREGRSLTGVVGDFDQVSVRVA